MLSYFFFLIVLSRETHSGLVGGSKDDNFFYADSDQSAQVTLMVLAVTYMENELLAAIRLWMLS